MKNIESRAMRKILGRFLPLLIICFVVSFLDRVNVGFAALTMNRDLGFSSTVFGLGAGLFFLGYVAFEVPSNLILERVGARRWIARIMITWGILSVGMAFVQGPWTFYTLRILLGIAEAGFFPGVMLYFTYWLPTRHRGRIISIFMASMPFANVIGSLINGGLMSTGGMAGLRNWQMMFVIEGLPAIVLALVVLKVLRDRPADAEWLSDAERQWLSEELARDGAARAQHAHQSALSMLRMPVVAGLALIYFGLNAFNFGLSFFLPQIVAQFHMSAIDIGLTAAVPMFAAGIGMSWLGHHSDRTRERRLHLVLPIAAAVVGLLASTFADTAVLKLAFLTVAAVGAFSALPIFWVVTASTLGAGVSALGFAVINSFGNLAGFGAPFLIGYLKTMTGSTASGLQVIAAYGCLVVAIAIGITRARRFAGDEIYPVNGSPEQQPEMPR